MLIRGALSHFYSEFIVFLQKIRIKPLVYSEFIVILQKIPNEMNATM